MESRRILSWSCTTVPYFRKPWYEYTDWRTYRKKEHHSQTRLCVCVCGLGGLRDLMLLWDCRTNQRRRDNRSSIWYLIGIDPVERLKILPVGKSIHFRHGAVPCIVSVWRYRVWKHNNNKKKRGGGEGAESNSPASHASERVREGQENKLKKREKKGLTREKKKVEMQVTQKQRAGGGKSNRQVLIFLQRWFIYPPYGNTTRLG